MNVFWNENNDRPIVFIIDAHSCTKPITLHYQCAKLGAIWYLFLFFFQKKTPSISYKGTIWYCIVDTTLVQI